MKKIIIIVCIFFSVALGQKSELKNVKVLPFTEKREVVKYMKSVVAKELGVKCSFCHNMTDYASDEKDHKKVAREMMVMTMNANKTMKNLNFHDISCWVCHRGNKHPDHPPNKNK